MINLCFRLLGLDVVIVSKNINFKFNLFPVIVVKEGSIKTFHLELLHVHGSEHCSLTATSFNKLFIACQSECSDAAHANHVLLFAAM